MKFKIMAPFFDKYNNNFYKAGEVVDFTEKRNKEINSTNADLIKAVKEKETTAKASTKTKKKATTETKKKTTK